MPNVWPDLLCHRLPARSLQPPLDEPKAQRALNPPLFAVMG